MSDSIRSRQCRYCRESFVVSREWQIFCSDRCRFKSNREEKFCFYCGDRATTRDHIYPASLRWAHKRAFDGVEVVLACRECNATLSNNVFAHPAERHDYIASAYRIKYKLLSGFPCWNEKEVMELGPSLRRRIRKSMALRRVAEERVYFACHMAALLRLDDNPVEMSDSELIATALKSV